MARVRVVCGLAGGVVDCLRAGLITSTLLIMVLTHDFAALVLLPVVLAHARYNEFLLLLLLLLLLRARARARARVCVCACVRVCVQTKDCPFDGMEEGRANENDKVWRRVFMERRVGEYLDALTNQNFPGHRASPELQVDACAFCSGPKFRGTYRS